MVETRGCRWGLPGLTQAIYFRRSFAPFCTGLIVLMFCMSVLFRYGLFEAIADKECHDERSLNLVEGARPKCSPCHPPLPSWVPAKQRAPPSPSRLPSTVSAQSLAHCCGICEVGECMSTICTKPNWSRTATVGIICSGKVYCWTWLATSIQILPGVLTLPWHVPLQLTEFSNVWAEGIEASAKIESLFSTSYISKNLPHGGCAAVTNWRG